LTNQRISTFVSRSSLSSQREMSTRRRRSRSASQDRRRRRKLARRRRSRSGSQGVYRGRRRRERSRSRDSGRFDNSEQNGGGAHKPPSPPQASGGRRKAREGDWRCRKCGLLNFEYRYICYLCKENKPMPNIIEPEKAPAQRNPMAIIEAWQRELEPSAEADGDIH